MEDNNNVSKQLDNQGQTPTNGNNGKRISFIGFLLVLVCACAFLPAIFIPWNKTEWIDDWHFYEYSSGFFLRALKVTLIAISVITWLVLLYLKYKQMTDNNGKNE